MWLTNQLANSNYKGKHLLVHVQVSIAKSILFFHGYGPIYKL